ncbi:MAG: GspH/FimT family pseudopilin [Proteobacteria bacterium]|nr:GspH/FimT family pseudopilin [Pseudomonadota bacterium]
MKHNGFSLIELLVVIAIIGILAGLGVANFAGLSRKYNVDNEVRRMYSDLASARIMAMNKNRTHFVALTATGYTVYDDNSPAPDGDGALTVGSDAVVLRSNQALNLSTVRSQEFYSIAWSGGTPQVVFNSRGLATTLNTVCVYSTVQPLYDCIEISVSRIRLGKLTTQGVCSAANCVSK